MTSGRMEIEMGGGSFGSQKENEFIRNALCNNAFNNRSIGYSQTSMFEFHF